jgi:hypothetical protein
MERQQSAKFAFYYMLSLVALIITAVSVVTIGFQLINKHIPDMLNQFSGVYNDNALKTAISALVIAAPIFYIMMWLIQKNLFAGALDKEAGVRKWLTYFIMLVAAVVMIVWLIMTINSFLDGELTAKFILKALTAIFISAIIFTFYFYEIRRPAVNQKSRVIMAFFYGSLAIVLIAFVVAVFNVESPTEARNRKLDDAILSEFDTIDSAINQYYNDKKKMPEALDQLKEDFNYITDDTLTDAVTGKKYDYKVVADKKYELCAIFHRSNKEEKNRMYYDMRDRWPHDVGYQCVSQKVFALENVKPIPTQN